MAVERGREFVVSATGGSFGYWRGLAAGSLALGNGTLTAAGEIVRYDGAWQVPDAARKYNAVLRWSQARSTKASR